MSIRTGILFSFSVFKTKFGDWVKPGKKRLPDSLNSSNVYAVYPATAHGPKLITPDPQTL
ncbi:MAG: hypothetical protein CM15mP49_16660 [Actinomycetota bacterium]|nr:MAG: hypothetical protein CM15mP49_16660 [Actinomycetota bacterium]